MPQHQPSKPMRAKLGTSPVPALDGFLDLLDRDIARHKDRVIFATEGFASYLQELTVGIEVDYDAPIEVHFQL